MVSDQLQINLSALSEIIAICQPHIEILTHYPGCADNHPFCRIALLAESIVGNNDTSDATTTAPKSDRHDLAILLLSKLVQRLQQVHSNPAYQSVWSVHQLHAGRYRGPKYDKELQRAQAYLKGKHVECDMSPELQALDSWINDTYKARSEFIANGGVNIDWLDPRYRVTVTEILAKASELNLSVDPIELRQWLQNRTQSQYGRSAE